MRKYLQLIFPGLLLFSGIAYYGAVKDLEVSLNTSETVTPLMIKNSFEAVIHYIMFIAVLLIGSRNSS